MNNESIKLNESIDRLLAADADYKAFVATSSATRNVVEGAKEFIRDLEAKEQTNSDFWAVMAELDRERIRFQVAVEECIEAMREFKANL